MELGQLGQGLCHQHFAVSYSSSEPTQPWVAHHRWSKSTRSCPQRISSLNSKESHFFLSTAWWLLELCSGWEQSKHFPAFLVGVQTAFMLNMNLGPRFGEFFHMLRIKTLSIYEDNGWFKESWTRRETVQMESLGVTKPGAFPAILCDVWFIITDNFG